VAFPSTEISAVRRLTAFIAIRTSERTSVTHILSELAFGLFEFMTVTTIIYGLCALPYFAKRLDAFLGERAARKATDARYLARRTARRAAARHLSEAVLIILAWLLILGLIALVAAHLPLWVILGLVMAAMLFLILARLA
jgi:hypothetical protein